MQRVWKERIEPYLDQKEYTVSFLKFIQNQN